MGRPVTAAEFEGLYRTTAPQLFAYLRRRGVPDPEDLVAEAFTIAWRRRSHLPEPALHRAWLFGTVRRLLLADVRERGREHDATAHAARSTSAPDDPGTDDGRRFERAVGAALERLTPDDRELIRLTEWEGLSGAEAAQVIGVRAGTARVRLRRARRALAADPELRAVLTERATVD